MLRRTLRVIGLLVLTPIVLFAVGVLWPLGEVEPVRTTTPLAITNVSIIDVRSGQASGPRTVLIERGRIAAIGSVAIPSAAKVIDGQGRYLIPALWDMHTHVFAVSPLLDMPLYIAYGVTNVRDMQGCPKPNDPFIACAEDKRRWTREAIEGKRIGPRVVATTSFMANGPGMVKRLGDVPAYFDTANAEQARAFVRHFARQRVEAIKVYDRIPRDAYFALVDEARRQKLDVVGHRPLSVTAIEAAAHQKSIEHARFIVQESYPGRDPKDRRRAVDEHDPTMAQAIFAAMKQHGTYYVPTHLTRWVDAYGDHPSVRDDPLLRYLHPLMKRQWLEDVDETIAEDPSPAGRQSYRDFYRKGLELTGAAHRAGVRVVAGTDYIVAGADLHRELQELVTAGLSPADALRAAIVTPAEYFGRTDDYGAVETGKVADLILLDANPLLDIRNSQRIAAVVFNGNLYDRGDLQRIRTHVERRARSWSVACKIIWRFLKNPGAY
ncbi:MAG TPA: amidohydrolase family protein [Thermoanaerobaculia bacterium]|jgi:imidazolonepropionase-like amidohydrolase